RTARTGLAAAIDVRFVAVLHTVRVRRRLAEACLAHTRPAITVLRATLSRWLSGGIGISNDGGRRIQIVVPGSSRTRDENTQENSVIYTHMPGRPTRNECVFHQTTRATARKAAQEL